MTPSSFDLTIRLAEEQDAAPIQAIYAPYVLHTPVSFETEPPSVEAMRQRIADALPHLPWLVCTYQDAVAGYVYASPHRALYTSLISLLRCQGFLNAYAGIALPNPASVGLHESLGFQPVGIYPKAGYKAGAWHDVGWWQLALREHENDPADPISLETAKTLPEWDAALDAGLRFLKASTLIVRQEG